MIKAKYFDKNDTDAMGEFMKDHPPRATKDSGGITLVQEGVYVIYDDEPLSVPEQMSWLTDQIRLKRAEILYGQPDYRVWLADKERLEKEIADLEEELNQKDETNTTAAYRDEIREKESSLEFKQAVLVETENGILQSEKNVALASRKIEAFQAIIEDIKSGSYVIP